MKFSLLNIFLLLNIIWANPLSFVDLQSMSPGDWPRTFEFQGDSLQSKILERQWLDWCQSHGHPFAQISWLRPDSLYHFLLVAGDYYPLDGIRLGHQMQTDPQILLRMAGVHVDQGFDDRTLDQIRSRLDGSGLFDWDSLPTLFRKENRNSLILFLPVRELPANRAEIQIGGQQGQWQGRLDLYFPNLGGMGRQFNFLMQSQDSGRQIYLRYREPWIGSSDYGLEMSADWQSTDTGRQWINVQLESRDFWKQPYSFGLQLGRLMWQSKDSLNWQSRNWVGVHGLLHLDPWSIDGMTQTVIQENNATPPWREELKIQFKPDLWSWCWFNSSLREAWVGVYDDADLRKSWTYAIGGAKDYRGLAAQKMWSDALILSRQELGWQSLQMAVYFFRDDLWIWDPIQKQGVWGIGLRTLRWSAKAGLQVDYAILPNQDWNQGLLQLSISQSF